MKATKGTVCLLSAFALSLAACSDTSTPPPPAPGPGPGPGSAPIGSGAGITPSPTPIPSVAATYYVDFDSGADTNNGCSPATAWKHCPGDASATATAQATPLAPGNIVQFKGGVRYRGTIRLAFNGVPNTPIVYDGNSPGSWGVGRAVIDGEHLNQNARRYGFVTDAGVSNVAIRSFEFMNQGGVANLSTASSQELDNPGYGIYLRDAVNVEVRDCYFHELGVWQNTSPASQNCLGGFGILVYGVDGLRVANCEFTRMEKGIRVSPGQYGQNKAAKRVLITECDFHDYMRWLVELSTSGDGATLDDITVSRCRFHDFTEFDSGVWQGAGACPHTDGIILGVSDCYKNRKFGTIRIHSNDFFQNATRGGGTAMIFSTGMGGNVQIYNNVFVNSLHGCGAIYVQDGPLPGSGDTPINFEIYNNSFFDARYAVLLRTITSGCNVGDGNIRIMNNAFYKAVGDAAFSVVVFDTNSHPKVMDYNCYYTPRTDQLIMMRGPQGYATLAEARSKWGWETHGMMADPKFANISPGIGTNSSQNNLHLSAGSPCIGAGANLSQVFVSDKDGQPRSPTQAWDIGAYKAP
jgi:hypothetical protein